MVAASVVGSPSDRAAAAQQVSVVPVQWIAKQFTEVLGRAPTTAEWNGWEAYYEANGCSAATLEEKSRELLLGSEFASRYSGTDEAARVVALVRAVYNHDPNTTDWSALHAPYASGASTWAQTVDAVFNGFWAALVVPGICNSSSPSYGFPYSTPLDVLELTTGTVSRSQGVLQEALDDAAATCGTVELQPYETITVGNNALLKVPDCVTLTTAGTPVVGSYARQGRIVGVGNQCDSYVCLTTPVVALGTGAELRNVWVDAAATVMGRQNSAVQLFGSTAADPGVVDNVRITDPGAGGAGIVALGFGVTGQACVDAVLTDNVVTGYARAHALDRAARDLSADGLAVHCEDALVQGNDVVDVGDWGIGLYGAWNRELGGATQQSQVRQNRILSAGTPGSVAIGLDAAGLCAPNRPGLPVPCIDTADERSFAGAVVEDNTFWTSSRTSFDVALLVGGKTFWGDHAAYGRGAVVRDNTTGTAAARANVGIAVSGMYDTTLAGNTATYTLVDSIGDASGDLAGCPQVNVGDTHPWVASLEPGSQASVVTPELYGCLLAPFPTGGLERVVPSTAGNGTFVGQSTGLTFTPWGHNYGPATEDLLDDDWTDEATFARVVADFRELRLMGANTLRLHPQLNKFMLDATTVDPDAFARLGRLAVVAEKLGIYLDITGLGAWRMDDNNVPDTEPDVADADDWLSSSDRVQRWNGQARFWEETARTLKDRTSVLFFNLMNEAVAEGGVWCSEQLLTLCFVQALSLTGDPAYAHLTDDGERHRQITRDFITTMLGAIAEGEGAPEGDPTTAVTIGNFTTLACDLFPQATCDPDVGAGFKPAMIGDLVDLMLVHAYPSDRPNTPEDEIEIYAEFATRFKEPGKPLVVEEGFYCLDWTAPVPNPVCDDAKLMQYINSTRPEASGWIGHATGATPVQIRAQLTDPNLSQQKRAEYGLFLEWRLFHQRNAALFAPCGVCQP